MDIETVKRELPSVFVRANGQYIRGNIRGRKNKFATVIIPDGRHWEFSWEAVARCVTNGTALSTD